MVFRMAGARAVELAKRFRSSSETVGCRAARLRVDRFDTGQMQHRVKQHRGMPPTERSDPGSARWILGSKRRNPATAYRRPAPSPSAFPDGRISPAAPRRCRVRIVLMQISSIEPRGAIMPVPSTARLGQRSTPAGRSTNRCGGGAPGSRQKTLKSCADARRCYTCSKSAAKLLLQVEILLRPDGRGPTTKSRLAPAPGGCGD